MHGRGMHGWGGGVCGRGVHGRGHVWQGSCMAVAGEMATAADGTHLIGMLSCCLSIYNFHNDPLFNNVCIYK